MPRCQRRLGIKTGHARGADPEEAHAFLRAAYVDNSMRITGSSEGFRMCNSNHDLGSVGFSSLSHTMAPDTTLQS